jgi:hypothetical protein
VQHILVGWVGIQVNLKQQRTKQQARKLVQEVLEKAQGPDADWKTLEKQYHEGMPGSSEASPVEKDDPMWPKSFSAGALSLRVGEVGLFETEYGYFIIKRVE